MGRLEEIPIERRVESFADDLNTRLGIVSGRVALLPRSTEIQPIVASIRPPPRRESARPGVAAGPSARVSRPVTAKFVGRREGARCGGAGAAPPPPRVNEKRESRRGPINEKSRPRFDVGCGSTPSKRATRFPDSARDERARVGMSARKERTGPGRCRR